LEAEDVGIPVVELSHEVTDEDQEEVPDEVFRLDKM
jgi:hypothetical protein